MKFLDEVHSSVGAFEDLLLLLDVNENDDDDDDDTVWKMN
jgi:hypothetical protein